MSKIFREYYECAEIVLEQMVEEYLTDHPDADEMEVFELLADSPEHLARAQNYHAEQMYAGILK